MDIISIPHAATAYLDRQPHAPIATLVVVTKLARDPSGDQEGAHDRMMNAIAREVQTRGLDAYEIHWSGSRA